MTRCTTSTQTTSEALDARLCNAVCVCVTSWHVTSVTSWKILSANALPSFQGEGELLSEWFLTKII